MRIRSSESGVYCESACERRRRRRMGLFANRGPAAVFLCGVSVSLSLSNFQPSPAPAPTVVEAFRISLSFFPHSSHRRGEKTGRESIKNKRPSAPGGVEHL